jgi:hypothetical protein
VRVVSAVARRRRISRGALLAAGGWRVANGLIRRKAGDYLCTIADVWEGRRDGELCYFGGCAGAIDDGVWVPRRLCAWSCICLSRESL